jgi:catechol 2,3-dioxygenase-like lactoylglutathione lyase family enzyme
MTIQHVALETRPQDLEAEVRFWGLLGFEAVEPPETLRDRATWLQRGATQVHLLYAELHVVPPQGHTAVVAADYDRTTAALREAGFVVEDRAQHWGAPRCFVHSPGGHRVEVMARAPRSSPATGGTDAATHAPEPG